MERVDSTGGEEAVNEQWLQSLINDAPNVLPVTRLYPRIHSDLLALGMEVRTPSGLIDNVFISPSGHLVIVETKLWRNPQARREVVAQLLDYASHVRLWDYEKIDDLWRSGHPGEGSLYESIKPDVPEDEWVDLVNDLLDAGEMLLLVVGDGIESRVERLAETVSSKPDLQFRLALIELQIYRDGQGRFLVVPHTLAKTREVEWATVRVIYEPEAKLNAVVEVPRPDSDGAAPSGRARLTLDAQSMFRKLEALPEGEQAVRAAKELLRQAEEHEDLLIEWMSAGFTIKTPDPLNEGRLLSLVATNHGNSLYIYPDWLGGQIERGWGDKEASEKLTQRLLSVLQPYEQKIFPAQSQIRLSSLDGSEAQFIKDLDSVVNLIQDEARIRKYR